MKTKNDAKTFRLEILYKMLNEITFRKNIGSKKKYNLVYEDFIITIRDIAIELFHFEFKNQSPILYDLYINAFIGILSKPDDNSFNVDMMTISEATYFILDIDPIYGLANLIELERIKSEDLKMHPQNKYSTMYRFFASYLAIISNKIFDIYEELKRSILSGKLPYTKDDTYYLNSVDVCRWAKEKNYIIPHEFSLKILNCADRNEQIPSSYSSLAQKEKQPSQDSADQHISAWNKILPKLKGAELTAAKLAIEKWRGKKHIEAYMAAVPDGCASKPKEFVSKKKSIARQVADKYDLTMPDWKPKEQ